MFSSVRRFLLLFIFSACLVTVSAASVVHQRDSLQQALKSVSDPVQRIRLLMALCEIYPGSDTAGANQTCRELTGLSSRISDSLLKAEGYRIAGNSYGIRSAFEKAFSFLNKAVQIAAHLNGSEAREIHAKALLNLGMISHQNGDFQTALTDYLEAEHLFYTAQDNAWLIRVYANLGDLYDKLNDTVRRGYYNRLAFGLVLKTNDLTAQIKAWTARANELANTGHYDEALAYYRKTIALSRQLGNPHLEHTAWYDMGYTYSRMEDYSRSLSMYTRAYQVALLNGDKTDMGDAMYKMGLTYLYMNRLDNARECALNALELAGETNSDILRRNVYDVLYSVEDAAGNCKKAGEYLNRYIDMVYAVFSDEGQLQVNFLNARFETEKRNNKIAQLEADKRIQQLNLRRQQLALLAFAVVLAFGLVLVLLLIRNHRIKQNLARKQVELQEQQISELEKERQLVATRSVLQGEESERSRMARDLHDGLGGLLSGVKINLSSMKGNSIITSENAEAFDHALRLLDSSIGELRRVAHNLMPETLNHYGLKIALGDFVSELGTGRSPAVDFRFFGEDQRYNPQLELSVYRISQELVNNALKHAGATSVNLQLMAETDRIVVQVTDNGKGFDPQSPAGNGKGLVSIRDRVAALNGRFELESSPGQGTEASIEFLVS